MKKNKRRVHELAKEFKVSSNAMKKILSELGFPVKSHMTTLEDEVVAKVRERFEAEKEAVKKEIANIKRLHQEVIREAKAKSKPKQEKKKERSSEKKDRKETKKAKSKKSKDKKFHPPKVEKADETKSKKKRKKRTDKKKKDKGKEIIVEKAKSSKKSAKKDESKKFVSVPTDKKIDEKEVKETIKKVLAAGKEPKKRYKKKTEEVKEIVDEKAKVRMTESIPLAQLAAIVGIDPVAIIEFCEDMGFPVTLNQRLDADTVSMVAEQFDFELETITALSTDLIERKKTKKEDFTPRSPVVTVMGHVDHGKTTLLDYIRHTNVIKSEFGGITQHIGAYQVHLEQGSITFIDTPGHAAFTAMRARGAKVTDIVILVVAADDGIMPQTLEAIDHAKAAGVPIIVAINKIDLDNANVERVMSQLSENGLVPEDWGGNTIVVPISARTGENVDKLLEMVLLQAEMMELEAIPNKPAVGVVIETRVEQGRGAVATVLIQQGTLKLRDSFVTGLYPGRVRDMRNDRGKKLKKAGPSTPVIVTGLTGTPNAGDSFIVVKNDKEARDIAARRHELRKNLDIAQIEQKKMSLEDFFTSFKKGEVKELKLIIKADTDGSAEALSDALNQLNTDEVKLKIIRKGVGSIVENDILLASTSDAIIIGFNVHVDPNAKKIVKREGVDIRLYNVIYKVTEDVRAAMEGLLEPIEEENILGIAEVRQVFKVPKFGKIAGSYITSGVITRSAFARLIREGEVIHDSKIESLKRFKEDVREVKEGYECGINITGFNDFRENDIIEAYEIIKVARRLS